MRTQALVALLALVACWLLSATSAWAQPQGEGAAFGWEETVVPLMELAPDQREALKKETGFDLSVGFAYRRAFLFAPEFSFWHWRGRFVLYFGGNLFEPSEQQWLALLGRQHYDNLQSPLIYRLPPGTAICVGLFVVLGFVIYRFPLDSVRMRRLLKEPKFARAVSIYETAIPDERHASIEERQDALALATTFLVQDHALEHARAEKQLRFILAELNRARTTEIRQIAAAYEQNGDWRSAQDLYQQAADLREPWDAKDHEFLRKCIARVEKRLA